MQWYSKFGLILLTVLLLSLSFAPFSQFYLAWVGLVPWLLVVRAAGSQRAAFLWSWVAGGIFFTANMWWLAYVSAPGTVALMIVLGLYWGAAAVIIRGAGLLWTQSDDGESRREHGAAPTTPSCNLRRPCLLLASPFSRILFLPAIWVALEWLRGNWPLNGLPWLFMGHGQTPILPMCQIADAAGVYGISFWVVAINTLVVLFVLDRFKVRRLIPACVTVAVLLTMTLGYGIFRMSQTQVFSPGPRVMVVQSNFPQSNTGEKGASQGELVDYHVSRTDAALRRTAAVDLVVWSETMMPYVNSAARAALRGSSAGEFIEDVHGLLGDLTRTHRTALLTGAIYAGAWTLRDGEPFPRDRRNTAFYYDRRGYLAEEAGGRYDKVHIVPFGEYLPFKDVFPPLYRFILSLSPYSDEYFLTPGDENAMTVFPLDPAAPVTTATLPSTAPAPATATAERVPKAWRFVTPICFEDIDPLLVRKMFRARGIPTAASGKAADFIVNITNDGWFKANQMPQHLQAARFRSIENRAPTARSVNTGISGFVDSAGRTHGLVPAGDEGVSVQSLQLDSRVTLYTRFGDAFAALCAAATVGVIAASMARWWTQRRVKV